MFIITEIALTYICVSMCLNVIGGSIAEILILSGKYAYKRYKQKYVSLNKYDSFYN